MDTEYFVMPKDKHSAYYSSVVESSNNIPRLYISFPILDNQKKDINAGVKNGGFEKCSKELSLR